MENIINNPGLQHLAEKVFWNLDVEDLKNCAQINQSCNQILQKPIFCLRKFEHISEKNKGEWIKDIKSVKDSDKGIAIISYLQIVDKSSRLLKKPLVNLTCYSNPALQDVWRKRIREICIKRKSSYEDLELVKIFAPLIDNPNAPCPSNCGNTPIYEAARNGHTEIIKILAPLTDNPNAPNIVGKTPIYWAAYWGHTEIVKILAPLTDNPNAPNIFGETPINGANNEEIQRILKSFHQC